MRPDYLSQLPLHSHLYESTLNVFFLPSVGCVSALYILPLGYTALMIRQFSVNYIALILLNMGGI